MIELTANRVRELLNYNKDTGCFSWIERRPGTNKSLFAGSLTTDGYLRIKIDGIAYKNHRLAWLFTYGEWPNGMLDHINSIKTDNRITNLREADHSSNAENQKKARFDNLTNMLGVSWYKRHKKYVSSIKVNGVKIHLGYFNNKDDAFSAYLTAKRKLHSGCTI